MSDTGNIHLGSRVESRWWIFGPSPAEGTFHCRVLDLDNRGVQPTPDIHTSNQQLCSQQVLKDLVLLRRMITATESQLKKKEIPQREAFPEALYSVANSSVKLLSLIISTVESKIKRDTGNKLS